MSPLIEEAETPLPTGATGGIPMHLSAPATPRFRDRDHDDRESDEREQRKTTAVGQIEQVVHQPDAGGVEPVPRVRYRLPCAQERSRRNRNIEDQQTTSPHAGVFSFGAREVKPCAESEDAPVAGTFGPATPRR